MAVWSLACLCVLCMIAPQPLAATALQISSNVCPQSASSTATSMRVAWSIRRAVPENEAGVEHGPSLPPTGGLDSRADSSENENDRLSTQRNSDRLRPNVRVI